MGFFNRRLDLSGGTRPREWSFPPKSLLAWLVIVIVVAFVAQYFTTPAKGQIDESWVTSRGWLSLDALKSGQVWTLVTHIFLHGTLIHIIANLLMIVFAGQYMNSVLGTKKFAVLFFVSGILGGVVHLLVNELPIVASGGNASVLIGASGAAFGLMIAFALLVPEQELFLLLYFIIPVRMRAKNLGRGMVIFSLVMGVLHTGMDLRWLPRMPIPLDHVAHWAHLGGALGGYLFMKIAKVQGSMLGLEFFEQQREQRDSIRETRDWRNDKNGDAVVDAKVLSEEIEARINPVLDKLNMEGIESLSPKELQILDEAQRELDRKAGGGL